MQTVAGIYKTASLGDMESHNIVFDQNIMFTTTNATQKILIFREQKN